MRSCERSENGVEKSVQMKKECDHTNCKQGKVAVTEGRTCIPAVVGPQEATTADRYVIVTETMCLFDNQGRRHGDLYNR